MKTAIPTAFPFESHYVDVLGSKIHYIEQGEGDPIIFLHCIPASSYVWRNIIPHLTSLGRCIAPDFIGFGKSDKPDIEYSITDHIKYIEKFIETLNLKKITFIMHGWGSIIGMDFAMRHEENCKGLVFYEGFLRCMNEEDISLPFQEQISEMSAQDQDLTVAMDGVKFIDKMLPQATMRSLSDNEMTYYREPFKTPGSEKALIKYWQEMPKGDGKSKVDSIVNTYSEKLMKSKLPKLMLYSIPGFITTITTLMWAKEHIPNLEIVEVGEELHYAQESNPFLMGEAISIWMQGVEQLKV